MSSSVFPETRLSWRKAKASGGGSANCVEVADAGQLVAVRDSKNPDGPRHTLSRQAFARLTSQIKSGGLDL